MRDACFLHPFCLFHFGYCETILSYTYGCIMLFPPTGVIPLFSSPPAWIVFYHSIVPRQVPGTYLQLQTMRTTPFDIYLGDKRQKSHAVSPSLPLLSSITHKSCLLSAISSLLVYLICLFLALFFSVYPSASASVLLPYSFSSASLLNKILTRI